MVWATIALRCGQAFWPSSMDAVVRQLPDVPHDSEAPLYPFGHGLTY